MQMIYSEDQYPVMRLKFSNYSDLDFMDFARSYFLNIKLVSRGYFTI